MQSFQNTSLCVYAIKSRFLDLNLFSRNLSNIFSLNSKLFPWVHCSSIYPLKSYQDFFQYFFSFYLSAYFSVWDTLKCLLSFSCSKQSLRNVSGFLKLLEIFFGTCMLILQLFLFLNPEIPNLDNAYPNNQIRHSFHLKLNLAATTVRNSSIPFPTIWREIRVPFFFHRLRFGLSGFSLICFTVLSIFGLKDYFSESYILLCF